MLLFYIDVIKPVVDIVISIDCTQLSLCGVQADLCYASAFDETEEQPSDTAPDVDTDTTLDTSVAAADSDIVGGMTEVASAPSLLMMSANDELTSTTSLSDLSLTSTVDDCRPLRAADCKPQLHNDFYFYQG